MKKLYVLALSAMFGLSAMAQVSVTFQVNMNDQTVSENGVHIAGDFQEAAGIIGDPMNWNPGTAEMTDVDMDGIYSLTVELPVGHYEYKFVNGNAWGDDEGVPAINKTGTSDNRFIVITDYHVASGFVVPAVMYAGTAPAGEVAVRLVVDMAAVDEISENGVHVAGQFFSEGWDEPSYGAMFPSADSKYVYVANVAPDVTYAYKYINGNDWGSDEWAGVASPEECTTDGNRTVVVADADVSVPTVCYEGCSTCTPPLPPSQLLFRVDMSSQTVSPNGVHVAGDWQAAAGYDGNWNPGSSEMTDTDGDGIYELMIDVIDQGSYQYKFVNGNSWEGDNNFPEAVPGECSNGDGNRVVVVGEDLSTVYYCFNLCSADCPQNPDPASITFRVDMTAETVAAEGVFLIGNFTNPVWGSGALSMTDDDTDGIYEVTTEVSGSAGFQYKFVNGDATVQANEEFDGNTEGLACNVPSGIVNGWNRTHTRTGVDEVLPIVPFGACGVVGVSEIDLGIVSIFPNPSNGTTYVEVQNPNKFKLIMSIVDVTGKTVRENVVLNATVNEVNTTNLNSGLYFLNIVNQHNDRSVYKLMVR